MKKSVLAMAGLMLTGAIVPLPALAQNAPPAVKQRAPGVPTAPQTDGAVRPQAGNQATPSRAEQRVRRDDRAQAGPPQPNRDPPMPRAVPSIIAP